ASATTMRDTSSSARTRRGSQSPEPCGSDRAPSFADRHPLRATRRDGARCGGRRHRCGDPRLDRAPWDRRTPVRDGLRSPPRFAEIVPSQPVNVAGHPPGLLLLVHWLSIDTAAGLAALVILAGGCTAPLSYLLARPVLAESRARLAALLVAFAPSTLLFGVTS